MIKSCATVIFLLSAFFTKAQQSDFCSDSSYRVVKKLRGQTAEITCDTAYLLNKNTFHLLYDSYHEYQLQSNLLSIFSDSVDNYIGLYRDRVETQKKEFNALDSFYRAISDTSKKLMDTTTARLTTINGNLGQIQLQIDSTKTNLTQVEAIVKKSQTKKWLFGAGGLLIGFVAATIVASLP
jgi:hypothetical protein